MTLKQWLENKWLVEHATSPEEITALLGLVDRDLADAKTSTISADWRLAIAYNAVLQCATAALAACGYRTSKGSSHHYYTVESLALTLGVDEDDVRTIDAFRKKRNISDYERAGSITDTEVAELIELAATIRARLVEWLRSEHPALVRIP
jgi:uncharacterized protein (UPF0332 family)